MIRCIRSPFVCGAGPLRAGIYDEGCSDASGSGGSAGSLWNSFPDGSATSQDLSFNSLGRHWAGEDPRILLNLFRTSSVGPAFSVRQRRPVT